MIQRIRLKLQATPTSKVKMSEHVFDKNCRLLVYKAQSPFLTYPVVIMLPDKLLAGALAAIVVLQVVVVVIL